MFQTIKSKIILSYFFLIAVTFAVMSWAIFNVGQLEQNVRILLNKNYKNVTSVERLVEGLLSQNDAQLIILNKGLKQGRKLFDENKLSFLIILEDLKKGGDLDEREENIIDTLSFYYDFYISLNDKICRYVSDNNMLKAQSYYLNEIRQVFETIKEKCFVLLQKNREDMMDAIFIIHNNTNYATYVVILGSLIAILIAILAVWRFSKYLIKPIENLTNIIQGIRGGKLDFKISTATQDEIGDLTEEIKMMMRRLKDYEDLNIDLILTEKKKSESIVESISEAIIVTDQENRIILINLQAEEIFNVHEHQVLGEYFVDVIHDKRIFDWIQKVISTREQLSIDIAPFLLYEIEEKKKYFRPKLTPMITPTNDLLGVVTILQDITSFKELDRMKSNFMATVSHEFRTPLTSINMSIDLLKQEIVGPLNQSQKDLINSTNEDLMRLRKMVRELLELSRLESDRDIIKKEMITISKVIDFTIKPLLLPFLNNDVELEINLEPDLPEFLGNEDQISTVITNLLNNALRYTKKNGKVSISAIKGDENIEISISDTGRGIPKEHQELIFDKFVQFKEGIDFTPGSVGLGLSISKEIVNSFGGKIWVESQVGTGSSFIFTIPIFKRSGLELNKHI